MLVGINESGKSNILKALSLLDPECEVVSGDLRDFAPDESTDEPAFVRFIFGIDKSERIDCLESVAQQIVSPNANELIVSTGERHLNLAYGDRSYPHFKERLLTLHHTKFTSSDSSKKTSPQNYRRTKFRVTKKRLSPKGEPKRPRR